MTKQKLLADLCAENEKWEALLAQIGEDRMDEPGVIADWSIKDIVAHLTGWRRRMVDRLQAAQRQAGEPPPPWPAHLEGEDEINEWIYQANRNRPVHVVLAEARQLFQQLLAAIEALPEAELMDPHRFAWTDGQQMTAAGFFAHFHQEHEPGMRAWLAQQKETMM